jgi:type II secretory pathway pseudopilin PulG
MKKKDGITLIALIITIIIMLLLSGVAIMTLFGNNGLIAQVQRAKFVTEMKALQERAYIYVAEKTATRVDPYAKYSINAGYENLVTWNYIAEEEKRGELLNTVLENIKEEYAEYADQIVIDEGEFYYVHNKKTSDIQKVKWCFESNIKVWGYKDWNDFEENSETIEEYVHNGEYKKINKVYACAPDLTGFNSNATYYVTWEGEEATGNEIMGTKTKREPPEDWYDYANKKWANIITINNDKMAYFVWIPRYMYKLDNTTQTSDVKFVDRSNNHKDGETDVITTYEELLAQNYILPETFCWGNNENPAENAQLAGYWISKYEVQEEETEIDAHVEIREGEIVIKDIVTSKDLSNTIYEYYLDDVKVYETPDKTGYTFSGLDSSREYTIKILARIIAEELSPGGYVGGSVERVIKPRGSIINPPDLTGYNPNTTYYLTWNGDTEIRTPITQSPPSDWYDYPNKQWANIVSSNNDKEAYFVWIPRYEYIVKNTSLIKEDTELIFIARDQTEPDPGFTIPETFSWGNEEDWRNNTQISGYWISKYEVQQPDIEIDTHVEIREGEIVVKDIVTSADRADVKYEYYLDNAKVYETTDKTGYTFSGLNSSKEYTIKIIARIVAAGLPQDGHVIGKTGRVIKPRGSIVNQPDLTGFNPSTTYYLTWNGDTEIRTPITQSPPSDWYNYSNKQWANIVSSNNDKEVYLVWIPRYEYIVKNTSLIKEDTELIFIATSQTEPDSGFTIPETFSWGNDADWRNNTQLAGYWISKYEVQDALQ